MWCEEPEEDDKKTFVNAPVEMPTLGAIRREPFGNLDNCVLDDRALAVAHRQFNMRWIGGRVTHAICRDPRLGQIRDPAKSIHATGEPREVAARYTHPKTVARKKDIMGWPEFHIK